MAIYSNYHFIGQRHAWRSKVSDKYKKELLKNSTSAEKILYKELKPLLKGISTLQKQKRFFTPKSFIIADFNLRAFKTIIEIDGEYHNNKEQIEIDKLKDEIYKYRGYKVIRLKNSDVIPNVDIAINKVFEFINITRPNRQTS